MLSAHVCVRHVPTTCASARYRQPTFGAQTQQRLSACQTHTLHLTWGMWGQDSAPPQGLRRASLGPPPQPLPPQVPLSSTCPVLLPTQTGQNQNSTQRTAQETNSRKRKWGGQPSAPSSSPPLAHAPPTVYRTCGDGQMDRRWLKHQPNRRPGDQPSFPLVSLLMAEGFAGPALAPNFSGTEEGGWIKGRSPLTYFNGFKTSPRALSPPPPIQRSH